MGAVLLGWTVFGTWQLGKQVRLDAQITPLLVGPVAGIVFTFPAIATVFASMYTPERTTISGLLAVLPLRESDRESAARWLVIALGMVFGGLWSAPLTLQFLLSGDVIGGLFAAVVCVLISLCGALCAQVLLMCTELVAIAVLGRRSVLTRGLSGLSTALAAVIVFLSSMPAQGREPGGPMLYLGRAIGWSMHGWKDGGWQMLGLASLLLALVASLAFLSWVPAHAFEWRRGGTGLGISGPRARSLVGLEVRQWLRYPNNAVMLVVVGGMALASVTIWRSVFTGANNFIGVFLILTLIGTLGVGSFGPTRAHHWIFLLFDKPLAWVGPKLASVLIIWSVVAASYGLMLWLTTGQSPAEAFAGLPLHVVELAAGCLVGIVLPVSREQSFAGSLSESMAVFVVVAVSLLVQQLPWGEDPSSYLASCALLVVVLIGAYLWNARLQLQRLIGSERTGSWM